jgi:hypothetical protein
MKNKIVSLLATASLLLVLSGCGGNVTLDNARKTKVTFSIDGNEYILDSGSSQSIKLDPGSHKVTLTGADGLVIKDTSVTVREGGILTSGTPYVIWKVLYGLEEKRAKLLHEEPTEIDSVIYTGDFRLFTRDDIYIEKSWDLGLNDDFPAQKKLYITSDYKIYSKIFREEEFRKMYDKLSQPEVDM